MRADVADLFADADARLREELGVDAGLGEVLALARRDGASKAGLADLQALVRERCDALEAGALDLRRLLRATSRLRRALPFTEAGWPEQLRRFESLAAKEDLVVVRAWLEYVDEAAAGYRLDALERLVDEAPLPRGYERLRERVAGCLAALQQRRYAGAAAVLAEGARHPDHGPVRGRTGHDLRLLLARMCARDSDGADLELWLDGSREPAALAIRAAAAGRAGDVSRVRSLLAAAREDGPRDIDVVGESVRQAIRDGLVDDARQLAEAGVAALPSLVDATHDVGRLVDAPSELWLAVALRAREEGFRDVAEDALRRAEAEAMDGPNESRIAAIVAERRAEAAQGLDRARQLSRSGEEWAAQGELATARARLEEALRGLDRSVDEELWATTYLRWADCVNTLAVREPGPRPSEFREALRATLAALAVPGVADQHLWGWAVEWDSRSALSGELDEPRRDHRWRGLVAAARAVAGMPDVASTWTSLADAAGGVGYRRLAIAAAEHAVALGSADTSTLAMWAAASGEHDLALEQLQFADDAWSAALSAETHLDLGRPAEALRLFSTLTLDPSWSWAAIDHVIAAVLGSDGRNVAGLARRYLAEGRKHPTDHDGLTDRGILLLLAREDGRAGPALEAARAGEIPEDQGTATYWLGALAMLAGERDRAVELMTAAMRTRDRSYLEGWAVIDRPLLARLARVRDLPEPDLAEVDAVVSARLGEVADMDYADPEGAARGGVAESVALEARRWVEVFDAMLNGELRGARERLADLPAIGATAVLADHLELAEALEVLGPVVHVDHEEGADADLDGVLRLDPGVVARVLYDTALDDEVDPAAVQRVVAALAGRDDLPADAADLLTAIPVPGEDPGWSGDLLSLSLPWSWFEHLDDPTQSHPIFLRHLPEMQDLHPEVPAIQVVGDAGAEPDRWSIAARDGTTLLSGHVEVGARSCGEDEWAVLPERLREHAVERDGQRWIPETAFTGDDRVPRLLTMTPDEFVVRQLVRAHDLVPGAAPTS